jgi:two-component system, NtrC family, response regulator AtoC
MRQTVLIVDDEELICRSLRMTLETAGYVVNVAASGAEAIAEIKADPPDCLVVDLRLGDMDGLEVFRAARESVPTLKSIVITAHGDVDNAVRALRLGAFDFIKKPFDVEEILASVQNALRTDALERHVAYLTRQEQEGRAEVVYRSEAMRAAMGLIAKIAVQPVPVVLIRGETGTGKELAARTLHAASDRARNPFIELNCSAIPEPLLESELFGHERGAFSDAHQQKHGLVEVADGGTLFLDEVGDLPASAQAKLLRFIETLEFRRVGGTKVLRVDCRVVAATHQNLEDMAAFRRDLYYRLAGVTVTLPPLRERGDDVLLLARHFLAYFARRYRKRLDGFAPPAEALLRRHRWPGNVRELRAAISSAALMAEMPLVGLELLPQVQRSAVRDLTELPGARDGIVPIEELELAYLRRVLELCGGNKVLAAQKLGISRQTLARKLAEVSADGGNGH